MKFLLIIFAALFTGFKVSAQETKIVVTDAETGERVAYANVCCETAGNDLQKYQITNIDGETVISLNGPTIISISCMGYETFIDTLQTTPDVYTLQLKPSYREIEAVVVTGQHRPVSADKSIHDIKLIGREKIERKMAVDLAGILSDELNMRLSHDPSTGTGLNIQGISGENIKILIDGVPVIGRLEGSLDLSQINLENVSHIEVVEGPMSVIYGSNALGGVINIITEKNTLANYKTSVDSYYESVGTYNFNFLSSLKKQKSNFELWGGRNFFGGFSSDTTRTKQWKPKEQYNAGFTWYYTGSSSKLRARSDYFRERLLDRNEPFPPYFEKANDTWFTTNRFNNSFELTQSIREHSAINLLGAYSYYERKKLKYLVDLTDLSSQLTAPSEDHDTTSFDGFMIRAIYSYAPENGALSLQAGIDINLETGKGKRIEDGNEKIGDYAAFASTIWKTGNLSVQPAIRVARNTKYDVPVVPSFNIMYKPGKTTLRTSWARGFRSPSLKELYLYFFDSNHQIEGNDSLQAERSNNFSFSAVVDETFRKTNVQFSFKTFYNIIEDKISLVQVDPDNLLHYQNENTGSFESLGGEISGDVKIANRYTFSAGVSRIGRKDEAYNHDAFVFSNNVNAGASINFLKNTAKLALMYKFSGKYPVYRLDSSGDISLGHIDNFHNLDVNLGKRFWANRLQVNAGVKNFFNNTEIGAPGMGSSGVHGAGDEISSLVGWGRTFFLNMKINIVNY